MTLNVGARGSVRQDAHIYFGEVSCEAGGPPPTPAGVGGGKIVKNHPTPFAGSIGISGTVGPSRSMSK